MMVWVTVASWCVCCSVCGIAGNVSMMEKLRDVSMMEQLSSRVRQLVVYRVWRKSKVHIVRLLCYGGGRGGVRGGGGRG